MIDPVLAEAHTDFEKIVLHLRGEYAGLQIGRASASLVEGLMVEAYGSKQPMKGIGSISVPDAKTVQIQPWDRDMLAAIEKAIQASDLHLTPLNDGVTIRLNLPSMTEERRKDVVKLVHKMAEDSRITLRNSRQKHLEKVRQMDKAKQITEDQVNIFAKKLQELVDKVNLEIDTLAKSKEKDIMTV